jgi:hypothetical protein
LTDGIKETDSLGETMMTSPLLRLTTLMGAIFTMGMVAGAG